MFMKKNLAAVLIAASALSCSTYSSSPSMSVFTKDGLPQLPQQAVILDHNLYFIVEKSFVETKKRYAKYSVQILAGADYALKKGFNYAYNFTLADDTLYFFELEKAGQTLKPMQTAIREKEAAAGSSKRIRVSFRLPLEASAEGWRIRYSRPRRKLFSEWAAVPPPAASSSGNSSNPL